MSKILTYTVNVKNEKRKSIDTESIYNWLQNKILSANPMIQDTSQLEMMSINEYKGMNALAIIGEFAEFCETELGMKQPENEEPTVIEEKPKPKVEVKQPIKANKPKEPEVTEEVEEPEIEEPGDDDEEDDLVTLDE